MSSPKQPRCPSCQSPDLRTEDATTGRHQCNHCGWRCVVNANGSTRDWLNIAAGSRDGRNSRRSTQTQRKARP